MGMGTSTVRRRVLVAGRVQGVFFRASLRDEALRLGVAGAARNRPDGRVEAVLEGPAAAVAELVAWCRHGPPRARVTSVEVTEEEVIGQSGFSVG
jgi:acylphosphatase